jgi:hypothetical protein
MVEDIVQALRNLGGQATLGQIYDEVRRIRKAPLPGTWQASVRGRLENHSSDSIAFTGKNLFRKIDKGIWALRDPSSSVKPTRIREAEMPSRYQQYSPPESFDTFSNYLRTMKEYRDFTDPASPTWLDYVEELFHILGFSTEDKQSRLIMLAEMGGAGREIAIVGYVHPGENYEEIIPGLTWDAYLRFAAKYHRTEWAILTNGLQLKIANYGDDKSGPPHYWPDLDRMIREQRLDSFFAVCKVFSYMRYRPEVPERQRLRGPAPRHSLRLEFWQGLLEEARRRTPRFARKRPSRDHWISVGAGKSGLSYAYVVRMQDAQVELYIDHGEGAWNTRVFETLYQRREDAERVFGTNLDWQGLDEKRACRIRHLLPDHGLRDREYWPEMQENLVDAMVRLERAFQPLIRDLHV